jgi:hypothetical protein
MMVSTSHSILAEIEDSFGNVLGKNPYGTIQGGWIKLRCVTIPLDFDIDYKEQGDRLNSMFINSHCYTSCPSSPGLPERIFER